MWGPCWIHIFSAKDCMTFVKIFSFDFFCRTIRDFNFSNNKKKILIYFLWISSLLCILKNVELSAYLYPSFPINGIFLFNIALINLSNLSSNSGGGAVGKSVRPASGRLGVWISGIIETLQSANKQTNNESNSSSYAIDWTSTIKLSNSLMKLIAPVYPACLCAFSVCHLTIFFSSETLKKHKAKKRALPKITCVLLSYLCLSSNNYISV